MKISGYIHSFHRSLGILIILFLIGLPTQSIEKESANRLTKSELLNQAPINDPDINNETLILTIDTFKVYWPELRFWLQFVQNNYQNNTPEVIENWDDKEKGMSIQEFYFSTAVSYAAKDRAIESMAKERGIKLSEEDKAEMEKIRSDNIESYGGISEYLRLVESMYVSEEVFQYLSKIDYLGNYLFQELYGANGEKCTDDEVQAYVKDQGLGCIKYIFLSKTDDGGNPLTPIDINNNRTLLEYDLRRLETSNIPEDFFDELASEYEESTKPTMYPDGLLFAQGTMDDELESSYQELSDYEYSGIIETGGGFYIIMRMPVYPEMVIDSSGETLRYRAAYMYYFKNQIEDRSARMKISYEDIFYELMDSYNMQ